MRILIISDIHANLTALEAVLTDAGEVDAVWCLGDLVGYGPDPNECIAAVCRLPNLICLLGNHDAAALDQIDADNFNMDARQALYWTRRTLTKESQEFLFGLPEKAVIESVTLAHGSPRQPVWEYLLDTRLATINFDKFDTPYCFVGHTHLPVLFYLPDESMDAHLIVPEPFMQLTMAPRAILNPGSVGQPRDRDPRAAYAIYVDDQNLWEFHRAEYDISSVQTRMEKANLPTRHIQRLSSGW
jgi:diadenosine tetraphosphatase ApaH/serine/threonine PP2A family protein phosphatase